MTTHIIMARDGAELRAQLIAAKLLVPAAEGLSPLTLPGDAPVLRLDAASAAVPQRGAHRVRVTRQVGE